MKTATQIKHTGRATRHRRVRAKIVGTGERPRLNVFRGLRSLYAQLIDDQTGKTILAVHSAKAAEGNAAGAPEGAGERSTKVAAAYRVGKQLAELAKKQGITSVVFDRGGYRYHGRVRAVAEGARDGGLSF